MDESKTPCGLDFVEAREAHLKGTGPTVFPAYTPDEQRVANYLAPLTGAGAGADPIGFLITSHQALYIGLHEIRDGMRKPRCQS